MSNAAIKSFEIVKACWSAGVRDIFIAPGSRNAPLTIAFSRSGRFNIHVVPDERCAGYMAMGASQNKDRPAAVLTTSGTAAVNLYPATVEAFYQQIPLILLTADRPPELIDQLDGQAIRQVGLFANHIKEEISIALDEIPGKVGEETIRIIRNSNFGKKGPVHINIPFEEPLYDILDSYEFPDKMTQLKSPQIYPETPAVDRFVNSLSGYSRIVILAGQGQPNRQALKYLSDLSNKNVVVIGDVVSNTQMIENSVKFTEMLFPSNNKNGLKDLTPDLLITFGLSIISKNLKLALRSMNIKEHWHVTNGDKAPDPFFSMPEIVNSPVEDFLMVLNKRIDSLSEQFLNSWKGLEIQQIKKFHHFLSNSEFFELTAVDRIIHSLPEGSCLHLGNSLSVRYANIIGISKKIKLYSNRGTSGIDGCVSTFIGHATANSDVIHTIIVGDQSFFYDRNALWIVRLPDNIKIIVLNNHGGGIFRMIDGPETLSERDRFFVNAQSRSTRSTFEEAGIRTLLCNDEAKLMQALSDAFTNKGPVAIEFESDMNKNAELFKSLWEEMNRFPL